MVAAGVTSYTGTYTGGVASLGPAPPRPTRCPPAAGAENCLPVTRRVAKKAAPGALPPPGPRPAVSALGDITNLRAAGQPMANSLPKKRGSTSAMGSPSKLRAVATTVYEGEAAEYMGDIVGLLYETEADAMPASNYIETQKELNAKMRSILVDWLAEVHSRYRLSRATLFLAVNLLDRYLSRAKVMRSRLQLVGTTALFVASKFEEVRPPPASELSYMTDGAFTVEQIKQFECQFLSTLGFKVLVPTAASFLDHLVRVGRCSRNHADMAYYILELGLLDVRAIRRQPSVMAASALLLSNEVRGQSQPWPQLVAAAARQPQSALQGCVGELRELLTAAPAMSLRSIFKKYCSPDYHSVARVLCGDA